MPTAKPASCQRSSETVGNSRAAASEKRAGRFDRVIVRKSRNRSCIIAGGSRYRGSLLCSLMFSTTSNPGLPEVPARLQSLPLEGPENPCAAPPTNVRPEINRLRPVVRDADSGRPGRFRYSRKISSRLRFPQISSCEALALARKLTHISLHLFVFRGRTHVVCRCSPG